VQLVESKTLVERHEKLASLGSGRRRSARDSHPLTAIKAALFIPAETIRPGSP